MKRKKDDDIPTLESPGKVLMEVGVTIFEQVVGKRYLGMENGKPFSAKKITCNPDHCIYTPLERCPWPLPIQPEPYGDLPTLYGEIHQYIWDHIDLPDERLFDVLTAFVIMTWRYQDFTVLPYISFLGPPASGKTRALEILNQICYRPLLSPNVSLATVYNVTEYLKTTLLLDETEVYMHGNRNDTLQLINAGYAKGQTAVRMMEEGNKLRYYDVFGPKVFAGTEDLLPTLNSRCILFSMNENLRRVKKRWDADTAKRGLDLRNKLLQYRFDTLMQPLPEFKDDVILNSRLEELFVPLISVSPPEAAERLYDYGRYLHGVRAEEDTTSDEAQLTQVLCDLRDKVIDGKLAMDDIANDYNAEIPEKEHKSPDRIGRRLKSLGFRRTRVTNRRRGIFYDMITLRRLVMRYMPNKIEAYGFGEVTQVALVTQEAS